MTVLFKLIQEPLTSSHFQVGRCSPVWSESETCHYPGGQPPTGPAPARPWPEVLLTYPHCASILKADCSRSALPRLSPRASCSLHTALALPWPPGAQHTSVWNLTPSHWPGLCPSLGHHLPRCFSSGRGMTCQTCVMSRLPSGARELTGGHMGPIRAASSADATGWLAGQSPAWSCLPACRPAWGLSTEYSASSARLSLQPC